MNTAVGYIVGVMDNKGHPYKAQVVDATPDGKLIKVQFESGWVTVVEVARLTEPPEGSLPWADIRPQLTEVRPPEYTPQVVWDERWHEGYKWGLATFAVQMKVCSFCGRFMLPGEYRYERFRDLAKQAVSAGFGLEAYPGVCDTCLSEDKATFICELCHASRSLTLAEHVDSGGRLCQVCLETVTAKVWREAVNKIEEAHRYDYA